MLYDPNWQKSEVKADPLTLEALIAWLEKQPRGARYDYFEGDHCLLGQWARSIDPQMKSLAKHIGYSHCYVYASATQEIDLRDFDEIAINEPTTFGAALDCARAALASRVHDGGAGRS